MTGRVTPAVRAIASIETPSYPVPDDHAQRRVEQLFAALPAAASAGRTGDAAKGLRPMVETSSLRRNATTATYTGVALFCGRFDAVLAVFDGHNDALTKDGHAALATGRAEGHLDLPADARRGSPRRDLRGLHADARATITGSRSSATTAYSRLSSRRRCRTPRRRRSRPLQPGRLAALEHDGHVRIARSLADVDAAQADGGPPVAVLHLEGAEAIDPELEALELWYAAGLRSLGPVWSRPNQFAHGVPFIWPSSPDTRPGLTPAGARSSSGAASWGSSSTSATSTRQASGTWSGLGVGPLVASHSAAHALCESSRNLTDRQLDAIGASGGLVGIVFACPFLRPGLRRRSRHTDRADRAARRLRRRADRGRARGARLGLRRGDDSRRGRRRGRHSAGA